MKKIAVFVVPHEDDFEIFGFHQIYSLIQSGYKIYEICMTDGRFGTNGEESKIDFGGLRLKKIRRMETINAAKTFGTNKDGEPNVEVIFMNYCDGYMPVNKRSINKMQDLIKKLNPDIILGMDPFFAVDWHHDHIATGRIFYFALKSMNPEERPRQMYFLQSYKNDVYIPLGPFDLFEKSISNYKSQISPITIRIMTFGLKLLHLFRSAFKGMRPTAGIRRVKFYNNLNNTNKIIDQIRFRLYLFRFRTGMKTYEEQYKPLPDFNDPKEELKIEDFDENIKDNLYKFYFGKENSR